MLLELAQWLPKQNRAINAFESIHLQAVRDDGPQSHLPKAGTPTTGGALILVAVVVTTLLWANLKNRSVWVVLAVTLSFGAGGWIGDYRKVVRRAPEALSARAKFAWQW